MNTRAATLDDVLARLVAIDAKLDAMLKRIASGSAPGESVLGVTVTLAELMPMMPKGLRSRASVHRLLAARAITGRKIMGTWVFDPAKVRADLDQFERVSSVSLLHARNARRRRV
jgi:hypothetical protein